MSWSLEEAITYYKKQGAPADQNALISLLREVQQENGGSIPKSMLPAIAQGCGVKEALLHALIRRLPSLRLNDRSCLEICAGPNCGKHTSLAAFAEKNCDHVTVKFVPCMRMCGKGPNIRWNGELFHRADEALLRRLMEE